MTGKGGKSALKSTAGKDDSSAKSKRGRRVQFDSEDENGRAVDTPTAKGGKGGKGANDAKKSTIKATPPERRPELGPFDMGLVYAKRGANYVKPQTVREIFAPLKKHGATDSEICLIANMSPETVDEASAFIPSLKPKMMKLREPLRIALDELTNLKQALANLTDPK